MRAFIVIVGRGGLGSGVEKAGGVARRRLDGARIGMFVARSEKGTAFLSAGATTANLSTKLRSAAKQHARVAQARYRPNRMTTRAGEPERHTSPAPTHYQCRHQIGKSAYLLVCLTEMRVIAAAFSSSFFAFTAANSLLATMPLLAACRQADSNQIESDKP